MISPMLSVLRFPNTTSPFWLPFWKIARSARLSSPLVAPERIMHGFPCTHFVRSKKIDNINGRKSTEDEVVEKGQTVIAECGELMSETGGGRGACHVMARFCSSIRSNSVTLSGTWYKDLAGMLLSFLFQLQSLSPLERWNCRMLSVCVVRSNQELQVK